MAPVSTRRLCDDVCALLLGGSGRQRALEGGFESWALVVNDESKAGEQHRLIHEAGHAVVARKVGLDLAHIGRGSVNVLTTDADTVAQLAAYYAAGCLAERIVLGAVHDQHGGQDREQLDGLRSKSPEQVGQGEAAAAAIVTSCREAIEVLAGQLRGAVTPQIDKVWKLIDEHCPEQP